jgi:serine phosphatase RsbU (regulator of sigma subunit)
MLQDIAQITLALAGASSVAQVGDAIVNRTVETLNAKSGYFATVDEQTRELVTRAQSGYPDWVVRDYARVGLDEVVPGCDVIRTGRPIYIESRAKRGEQFSQYPDDPTHEAFVVVPLPPVLGARAVLAFGFDEPRSFSGAERAYLNAVVEACAQALQRATAYEAEQTARRGLRVLLDSSEQLNALNDPDLVADAIVQIAATRIGSWASLVRVKPDGGFERVAAVHRDPELTPVLSRALDRVRGTIDTSSVLETGEPLLLHGMNRDAQKLAQTNPEVWELLERIGVASCLLVPISVGGRNLAVLSVGDGDPGRLREAEVDLAVDLGRRGASALERARLWQASQRQLEAEHHIVELLQRSIVPDALPDLEGVAVAAAYRPAERDVDVGGDWYDAFVAPAGAIVIAVGDVAGHGMQAASLMGRVRNALRAYAIEDTDPASVLLRLHTLLRAQDAAEMVTAFVARFDPATRVLTWSRAGHPPPLVVGPEGRAHFLDAVNGAPLGAMARPYRSAEAQLPPGSLVVCYTDGLIERRDRILDDGLAWLEARVCQHVNDEVEILCNKLVDDPFVPHPAPDDVCVLALRTGAPCASECSQSTSGGPSSPPPSSAPTGRSSTARSCRPRRRTTPKNCSTSCARSSTGSITRASRASASAVAARWHRAARPSRR